MRRPRLAGNLTADCWTGLRDIAQATRYNAARYALPAPVHWREAA